MLYIAYTCNTPSTYQFEVLGVFSKFGHNELAEQRHNYAAWQCAKSNTSQQDQNLKFPNCFIKQSVKLRASPAVSLKRLCSCK